MSNVNAVILAIITKLTPHLFVNLDKIDTNEVGYLDFCPVCEEKLEDKRVLTLKKHELKKHSRTDKELVKLFITRSGALWVIILVVGFGVALAIPLTNNFIFETDVNEYISNCEDVAEAITDSFVNSGITDDTVRLLDDYKEECRLVPDVYVNATRGEIKEIMVESGLR